ncbi:MAG: hypothetical protein ABW172_16565 [Candidatus Binatia bacterium]
MNSLCHGVLALALAGTAIACSGCSTILTVREQQRRADENAVIIVRPRPSANRLAKLFMVPGFQEILEPI